MITVPDGLAPNVAGFSSPFRLETTVAALAYNRTAQGAFDQHNCIVSRQKGMAHAQTAGY